MKTEVYSIPGKMVGHYDGANNAMIDSWSSLLVSLDEFKAAVYDVGIDFARKNKVTTWIVDNSTSNGVYKKEVQDFIGTTVAPKCAEIGIKYFFVILPQSAIAKLSAKNVAKINSNQKGMQTLQVASVEEALKMVKEAAS